MVLDYRVIQILRKLGFPYKSHSRSINFDNSSLMVDGCKFTVEDGPRALEYYEENIDEVRWLICVEDDQVFKFKNPKWFEVDSIEELVTELDRVLHFENVAEVSELKNIVIQYQDAIREAQVSIGYIFSNIVKFLEDKNPRFSVGDVLFEDLDQPREVKEVDQGYYRFGGGHSTHISLVHVASLPRGAKIITSDLTVNTIVGKDKSAYVDQPFPRSIGFTLDSNTVIPVDNILGIINWGTLNPRVRKTGKVII